MNTSWFKKESIECSGTEVDININRFCQEYKTQTVLVSRPAELNGQYRIEVWFNFDSQTYLINLIELNINILQEDDFTHE